MSKKLVTGAMSERNNLSSSQEIMKIQLVKSQLENMMKSKVMKKRNTLPVQNFKKSTVHQKNSVPGFVTKFLTEFWKMSSTQFQTL